VTSPVLACKAGVRFKGFTVPLLHLLGALLRVGRARGEVLTITSGSDGQHSLKPYSRHYTLEAVDFRTKHLATSAEKHDLIAQVQRELGDQFSVLLENEGRSNEHGHAQVKRGHEYSEDD
jgi:hypothetical protein